MTAAAAVDSGVLIAFLDPRDHWHRDVVAAFAAHDGPFVTVEPVLGEVAFLLSRNRRSPWHALELVDQGLLSVVPVLDDHAGRLSELMQRYRNVPMSLADACLVALTELMPDTRIMSLDSDFEIYRRFRNDPLPLLSWRHQVQEKSADYHLDPASDNTHPAITGNG